MSQSIRFCALLLKFEIGFGGRRRGATVSSEPVCDAMRLVQDHLDSWSREVSSTSTETLISKRCSLSRRLPTQRCLLVSVFFEVLCFSGVGDVDSTERHDLSGVPGFSSVLKV